MKIAVICGSVKIGRGYWDALAQNLNLTGWVVLTVNVWNLRDFLHTPRGEALKKELDGIHKEKISLCQKVFVLSQNGHIGESTRSEIEYAQSLAKPIEYVEVTENHPRLLDETDFGFSQFAIGVGEGKKS